MLVTEPVIQLSPVKNSCPTNKARKRPDQATCGLSLFRFLKSHSLERHTWGMHCEFHIAATVLKLDSSNRTHAVAKALSRAAQSQA